jgi:hypothetical protein
MRRSLSEPFRDFAWTSGLAGYSFGLIWGVSCQGASV